RVGAGDGGAVRIAVAGGAAGAAHVDLAVHVGGDIDARRGVAGMAAAAGGALDVADGGGGRDGMAGAAGGLGTVDLRPLRVMARAAGAEAGAVAVGGWAGGA